jgi:hypothetical protein
LWYGAVCEKGNLIIGVKDNLRVGLGLLSETQEKLIVRVYLKSIYCGKLGHEFVSRTCVFFYQKKSKPIHVDCLGNEKLKQYLLDTGLSESRGIYIICES